jgi:predicted DNA-binding transcriptional regulator YafY
MSKRTFFKRYVWLFDTIRNKPYITFKEIFEKFALSEHWRDETAGFSKRTFQRDICEIAELFGVDIEYNTTRKGYFIDHDLILKSTSLLIDSYRIISALEKFRKVNAYISTGVHNTGSEYILPILRAIKKGNSLSFLYSKYANEEVTNRSVDPYFLKEFKFRWYLVGKDKNDKVIKTFALERIQGDSLILDSNSVFEIPNNISPETYFEHNFGIFTLPDAKVERIKLLFSPLKGKFLKSVPLHKTQKVLVDNDIEFRIELQIQITHDFIMEILSHGSEVRVLQPQHLVDRIVGEMEKGLERYR